MIRSVIVIFPSVGLICGWKKMVGRFENGFSQFLLCERAGLTENVKEGCEKTDLDKVVADCSRIFQSVRMR